MQQTYATLSTMYPKVSPPKEVRSKMFKEVANVKLRGATFDAKHLDSFLKSEYGEKAEQNYSSNKMDSDPKNLKNTMQTSNTMQTYHKNDNVRTTSFPIPIQTNVRPTHTFISVPRDNNAQTHYVDLSDKSQTLLDSSTNISTSDKNTAAEYYSKHREEFLRKEAPANPTAGNFYGTDNEYLRGSKSRMEELRQRKQMLTDYNDYKKEHAFLSKREKLVKSGWRHGITGVETPLNQAGKASLTGFYDDIKEKYNFKEQNHSYIQEKRSTVLNYHTGTSPSLGLPPPVQSLKNEIEYKTKGRIASPDRYRDTHNSIFRETEAKYNPARAQQLWAYETKAKGYNIISGARDEPKIIIPPSLVA